jgi:hypothetical protein
MLVFNLSDYSIDHQMMGGNGGQKRIIFGPPFLQHAMQIGKQNFIISK